MSAAPPPASGARRLLAACVHLYTALGLPLAAGAAVLVLRGGDDALRWAFGLLFLATLIDATDGWLARRLRVAEVLPSVDGRRLDDIVDFHCYTSLPLLLVWACGVLPGAQGLWLLVPLLASAYGFAQVDAKTADGFFLGFPSYWNVVAFYLCFLTPPPSVALALLLGLALLTFLPIPYLYPSQPGRLNALTRLLGVVWAVMLAAILADAVDDVRAWTLASLFFPLFYLLASWTIALRRARG